MANDLTRFGIKEVADVAFYKLDGEGQPYGDPVLTFDTLKVSNIEMTAEQAEARGGKGNAPLIIWDYGREITLNLEDALLSMETLSVMFENEKSTDGNITISANTFPGTYYVEGKTFARHEGDGQDRLFTFKIYKAKINSEVTLSMEAEGDPTVFSMSLRVLRDKNGNMMELEKDDDIFTGGKIIFESKGEAEAVIHEVIIVDEDGKVVDTYYLAEGEQLPVISGYTYTEEATTVTHAGIYYVKKAST